MHHLFVIFGHSLSGFFSIMCSTCVKYKGGRQAFFLNCHQHSSAPRRKNSTQKKLEPQKEGLLSVSFRISFLCPTCKITHAHDMRWKGVIWAQKYPSSLKVGPGKFKKKQGFLASIQHVTRNALLLHSKLPFRLITILALEKVTLKAIFALCKNNWHHFRSPCAAPQRQEKVFQYGE